MSYGGYEYGNSGAAAAGGGGFLTQASDGGGGEAKRGGRDKQSLVPMTIKQVLSATRSPDNDEVYTIDGRDVHQIRIVGNILNVDVKETRISLKVEDLTGCIELTMWIQGDANEESEFTRQRRDALVGGVYVSCVGTLKDYQGKFSISAFDIRPIEDFDEITHHFLEAMYVHAKSSNSLLGGAPASGFVPQSSMNNGAPAQSNAGGGAAAHDARFTSPMMEEIFNFYTSEGTGDEGLHYNHIVQRLGYTEQQVRESIEYLSSEGHIYSTIDDDHHKSSEE